MTMRVAVPRKNMREDKEWELLIIRKVKFRIQTAELLNNNHHLIYRIITSFGEVSSILKALDHFIEFKNFRNFLKSKENFFKIFDITDT